jgi:hypothetical protein
MLRIYLFILFLIIWIGLGTSLRDIFDKDSAMILFGGIMYLYAKMEDWVLFFKGENL